MRNRRGEVAHAMILPAIATAAVGVLAVVGQTVGVDPEILTTLLAFGGTVAAIVTSHVKHGQKITELATRQEEMAKRLTKGDQTFEDLSRSLIEARWKAGINGEGGIKGDLARLEARVEELDEETGTHKNRHRIRNIVTALNLAGATGSLKELQFLSWDKVDKTEA